MVVSSSSSSSWGSTLLMSLFLCGFSAQAMIQAGTHQPTRLRSSHNTNNNRQRQLQDDGGTTPQKTTVVRNIELRVGDASAMLSSAEMDQFESIVEDWFLKFYADGTLNNTVSLAATTVTFKSQTINAGNDSIIRYDQTISYTPTTTASGGNNNPEKIVTVPFANIMYNAELISTLSREIAAMADRMPGIFLDPPEVLGVIPTETPTKAPTTEAPTKSPITVETPTDAPIVASTDTPTDAPVRTPIDAPTAPSAEPTTTSMAPTVVSTVSSAPVVPTAAPTWSMTTVTLKELELVYSNVDSINDRQLKIIEDITELWFNDYYNATLSSSSVSDDADEDDMAPNGNVTAVFNFTAVEYVDRTMTVLLIVQLTYQGDPEDALTIVQTPWQEVTSVGAYRQLLVAGLPLFFDNVEAPTPPKLRRDDDKAPPKSDDDLSTLAIIGIVVIVMAVIVLIGVVAKLQYGIIARRKRQGGDKISPSNTTPYRPQTNEEEDDSVLFPPAPTPYSSHINNRSNVGGVTPSVDGITAAGMPMPSGKSDDQSYDGKR
jgi:hypothetical protein